MQTAAFGGAEGIELAIDHDAHFTRRAAPLADDLILGPCIGEGFGCRAAFIGHQAMAGDQQQGPEGDGLARADIAVGENAADQWQQIDQRGVGAVGRARRGVVEQEMLRQIEDQDAAHAVVGEALPHLGEEQDDQPLGVMLQDLEQHRHARNQRDDQAQDDDDIHVRFLPRSGARPAPLMSAFDNGLLPLATPHSAHEGAFRPRSSNPDKA